MLLRQVSLRLQRRITSFLIFAIGLSTTALSLNNTGEIDDPGTRFKLAILIGILLFVQLINTEYLSDQEIRIADEKLISLKKEVAKNNLQRLIRMITEMVDKRAPIQAAIWILDKETGELKVYQEWGLNPDQKKLKLEVNEGIIGKYFWTPDHERQPFGIKRIDPDEKYDLPEDKHDIVKSLRSIAFAIIHSKNNPSAAGVLAIHSDHPLEQSGLDRADIVMRLLETANEITYQINEHKLLDT